MQGEYKVQSEIVKILKSKGFMTFHMDSAKAIGYMRGDASMMGSYINRIKSLGWTRGQPDLCVVKPSGDVFFIEFKKTSKTKLSEDQEEVHDSLKLRQVQVYVVSSIDDLDFLLDD